MACRLLLDKTAQPLLCLYWWTQDRSSTGRGRGRGTGRGRGRGRSRGTGRGRSRGRGRGRSRRWVVWWCRVQCGSSPGPTAAVGSDALSTWRKTAPMRKSRGNIYNFQGRVPFLGACFLVQTSRVLQAAGCVMWGHGGDCTSVLPVKCLFNSEALCRAHCCTVHYGTVH